MMLLKPKKLKPGFVKTLLLLVWPSVLVAQPKDGVLVDQVAAVVGTNTILHSEIETQYLQLLPETSLRGNELRCKILDQLLLNKLLLHQAKIDSLDVTDEQVDSKISQNMSYYVRQFGSVEKLEQFYGKSMAELKAEFRPLIRDQLLSQQMQGKITGSITASPSDVKSFFENIPKDSLPLINAEIEYGQILRKVPVSEEEKNRALEQIRALRDRIVKGEDFSTLAILYSQDKESAKQGGELGFVNRGDLVPEFEAVAFRLKNNTEISQVVESPFGYHIIQLIERRGERINCRHILIRATVTAGDMVNTQKFLDSLSVAIRDGKISFAEAAEKYSDDGDSKMNGGLVVNQSSGATRFEADQIDPTALFILDKLNPGEVSGPGVTSSREGDQAYRILQLRSRTEPHRLNLKDDYQRLQELALSDKQNRILENWRNKKKATAYIRISESYNYCNILKDWITP